jgi:hypothetical protein
VLTCLQSHPCAASAVATAATGNGAGAIAAVADAFELPSAYSTRDAASTYCPNADENDVSLSPATDFAAADDDIAPAVDAAAVAAALTSIASLFDAFTGSAELSKFGG